MHRKHYLKFAQNWTNNKINRKQKENEQHINGLPSRPAHGLLARCARLSWPKPAQPLKACSARARGCRPSSSAVRVAGATSKAPRAEYAFAAREAGLLPARLHLNGRGPPTGLLTSGARCSGCLLPLARIEQRQERRGRAGAGVLPSVTGHLRRCPAHRRVQEATPHPPRCAMPAGVVGCERTIGHGGRGWRW